MGQVFRIDISDTYSIPACTRYRGKHVRGYFTTDDTGTVFQVMDASAHLFAPRVAPPPSREQLAQIRISAAELVRECRAMFPTLNGDWTRRDWNDKCRITGQTYVRNTITFLRANAS